MRLETPSGHRRTVDLSRQALDVLRRLGVKRKAEAQRRGYRHAIRPSSSSTRWRGRWRSTGSA